MSSWFNLTGTLSALRLFRDPSLCLPHLTISSFAQLPVPLSIPTSQKGEKAEADIRAVILDKDNCFAVPHTNEIFDGYKDKFDALRKAYPGSKLLIVSNTAGTTSADSSDSQAKLLEANTGVTVLRHDVKKPGCGDEIMTYFRSRPDSGVTMPSQVAIVGDRLLTDVMMANSMGAYAVWTRDGVVEGGVKVGFLARSEASFAQFLTRRGYSPPNPESFFE